MNRSDYVGKEIAAVTGNRPQQTIKCYNIKVFVQLNEKTNRGNLML